MTSRGKVLLIALFAVCGLGAYGVYWWHELSLDAQVVENQAYHGSLLIEVRRLAAPPRSLTANAGARLAEMPEFDRVGILTALAEDGVPELRYFAVAQMVPLRRLPRIRAALARLAERDPDEKVREAARKVLTGHAP
jgi:hypothetical protein